MNKTELKNIIYVNQIKKECYFKFRNDFKHTLKAHIEENPVLLN